MSLRIHPAHREVQTILIPFVLFISAGLKRTGGTMMMHGAEVEPEPVAKPPATCRETKAPNRVGSSDVLRFGVINFEISKEFFFFGWRDTVTRIEVEASLEILLKGNPFTLVFDGARPRTHGD